MTEQEAKAAIERALSLPHNWDGDNSVPPNAEAGRIAADVLDAAFAQGASLYRVVPSVCGGIAILFGDNPGERYADVEIDNDGEVMAATSDRKGDVRVWEVDDYGSTFARIDAHLKAERRA